MTTMKRTLLFLLAIAILIYKNSSAQSVAIGSSAPQPHVSALLDLQSTNKGFLPPRMTWAQVKTILQPAAGLVVFDTDINRLRLFNGLQWIVLGEQPQELTSAPGVFNAAANISSTDSIVIAKAMKDAAGNTIVAGYYRGTVSYGHYNFTSQQRDIFFAKFDKTGKYLWMKPMGGPQDDEVTDMDMDAAGNIYLGGNFQSSVDFDPDPVATHIFGSATPGGFYAKYNADGEYILNRSVGGQSTCRVTAITVDDATGRIFYAGKFSGTGNFNYGQNIPNPPQVVLLSQADDIFFACASADGWFVWAKRLGNEFHNWTNDLLYYDDNLFLTFDLIGTMDFDPNAGTQTQTASQQNGCLGKYSATDGSYIWGRRLAGTEKVSMGRMAMTSTGILAVGGKWKGVLDFDWGANVEAYVAEGENDDLFVGWYGTGSGTFYDVSPISCSIGGNVSDITTDNMGNTYASFTYMDTARVLTTNGLATLRSPDGTDLAMCKFNASRQGVWAEEVKGYKSEWQGMLAVSPDGKNVAMAVASASVAVKYPVGQVVKPVGGFLLVNYVE
jgi:hypothetical protein